jgi:hypothetical protein
MAIACTIAMGCHGPRTITDSAARAHRTDPSRAARARQSSYSRRRCPPTPASAAPCSSHSRSPPRRRWPARTGRSGRSPTTTTSPTWRRSAPRPPTSCWRCRRHRPDRRRRPGDERRADPRRRGDGSSGSPCRVATTYRSTISPATTGRSSATPANRPTPGAASRRPTISRCDRTRRALVGGRNELVREMGVEACTRGDSDQPHGPDCRTMAGVRPSATTNLCRS